MRASWEDDQDPKLDKNVGSNFDELQLRRDDQNALKKFQSKRESKLRPL